MDWKESLMKSMNEWTYNRFLYYYNHLKKAQIPKPLDLKNPVTFNEKTIWLKMNQRYTNANVLTDKVLAKNFVSHEIGDRYLIPTIAVYDSVSQIDFEKLPSSFVLKANHGSGWNVICEDKNRIDLVSVRGKLTKWLNTNYYDIGKEYQYRDIIPRILCEAYLENSRETALVDYKVFCFSGKAIFIQVDLDRFTNHRRNVQIRTTHSTKNHLLAQKNIQQLQHRKKNTQPTHTSQKRKSLGKPVLSLPISLLRSN